MSWFGDFLKAADQFAHRCPQCNRKMRNRVQCQACGASFCSANCCTRHIKVMHADILAEEKRQQMEGTQRRQRARSDFAGSCPLCGAEFRTPRRNMGKTISCPNCSARVRIPEAELIQEADSTPAPASRQPMSCLGLIGGLFCLFVIAGLCTGVVTGLRYKGPERDIRLADIQYGKGMKEEAVRDYKKHIAFTGDSKAEVLRRIVEFESEQGNEREARKWIEQGLDEGLKVDYKAEPVKRLLATIQREREQRTRDQKAPTPSP